MKGFTRTLAALAVLTLFATSFALAGDRDYGRRSTGHGYSGHGYSSRTYGHTTSGYDYGRRNSHRSYGRDYGYRNNGHGSNLSLGHGSSRIRFGGYGHGYSRPHFSLRIGH